MAKSLLAIRYLTFVRSQELRDYNKQARKYGIGSALGYPGTRDSLPPRKKALKQYLSVFAGRENSLRTPRFCTVMTCVEMQSRFSTVEVFLSKFFFVVLLVGRLTVKNNIFFSCIRYSKQSKIYNFVEREARAPRVTPTRIARLKRVWSVSALLSLHCCFPGNRKRRLALVIFLFGWIFLKPVLGVDKCFLG